MVLCPAKRGLCRFMPHLYLTMTSWVWAKMRMKDKSRRWLKRGTRCHVYCEKTSDGARWQMLSIEFYLVLWCSCWRVWVCGIGDKKLPNSAKPLWALSFHCRTRLNAELSVYHIPYSFNFFLGVDENSKSKHEERISWTVKSWSCSPSFSGGRSPLDFLTTSTWGFTDQLINWAIPGLPRESFAMASG